MVHYERSRQVILHPRTALAAVVSVALIPSVAQASTKTVYMGAPPAAGKTLERSYNAEANDFFPTGVRIHVGDKVKFVPTSFHTIDFTAKGQKLIPVVAPTGKKVTGVLDAANAPFWFNDKVDALGLNGALLSVNLFGKSVTFAKGKRLESGLPVQNKPKPITVKFTKAGKFTFHCDVHPLMKGTVRVVAAGKPVPSAKADAKTLATKVAGALKSGKALSATATSEPNTVQVGLETGSSHVSFFGFAPANLTVAHGTTVTFKMGAKSELHTATTGPGDPEKDPKSYLGVIANSLQGPSPDARVFYPSDPPGAVAGLTPSFHGNGFWSSGAMDLDSASPQPALNAVRFDGPGTYQFYCMIHPFMHGTITVT
jgi:plastocyanin